MHCPESNKRKHPAAAATRQNQSEFAVLCERCVIMRDEVSACSFYSYRLENRVAVHGSDNKKILNKTQHIALS